MSQALSIRVKSAEAATTSAPTVVTDGIEPPPGHFQSNVDLQIDMSAASGTRSCRIVVWGWCSVRATLNATTNTAEAVASSGAWYELYDTGTLSDAADFAQSIPLDRLEDYSRHETEVRAIGGTTPALTVCLAYSDRAEKG